MAINTSARVIERMSDSESSIRDVDLAKAVTTLSSSQILAQTAASFAVEADLDIEPRPFPAAVTFSSRSTGPDNPSEQQIEPKVGIEPYRRRWKV